MHDDLVLKNALADLKLRQQPHVERLIQYFLDRKRNSSLLKVRIDRCQEAGRPIDRWELRFKRLMAQVF